MNEGQSLGVVGMGDISKRMSELSSNTKRPFSQTEAHAAINLLKSVIFESLKKGQKVQITGFASFSPTYRSPRKAHNILTGEPLVIPEGINIVIKAGNFMKSIPKEIDDSIFQEIKSKALSKKS